MSTNDDQCKKLITAYESIQQQLDILTSGELYFETDYVISLRQTVGKIAEQIQLDCPEYFENPNQTQE